MAEQDTPTFMPMPLRKRAFLPVSANQYRVVAGSGESREIEANTAYEAFKLSGFADAIKIERMSNILKIIIESKYFKEETPAGELTGAEVSGEAASLFSAHHKNVFSADEMDTMIRSLQSHARAQEAAMAVPAPTSAPSPEFVAGPTGVDVHGDGYDEIIPSAPAVKQPAAPKAEAKETAKAEIPSAPSEPAKELSPEEVEKLLGGK